MKNANDAPGIAAGDSLLHSANVVALALVATQACSGDRDTHPTAPPRPEDIAGVWDAPVWLWALMALCAGATIYFLAPDFRSTPDRTPVAQTRRRRGLTGLCTLLILVCAQRMYRYDFHWLAVMFLAPLILGLAGVAAYIWLEPYRQRSE
jgi:uncharacterized integral membrane protein